MVEMRDVLVRVRFANACVACIMMRIVAVMSSSEESSKTEGRWWSSMSLVRGKGFACVTIVVSIIQADTRRAA